MISSATPTAARIANYHQLAEGLLRGLKRDRDRQILSRRFGFGMTRRQTLERIGQDFEITRERVRQIEKSAMTKLATLDLPERTEIDTILIEVVRQTGGIAAFDAIAALLGATPQDRPYLYFLAQLAPGTQLIEDDDNYHAALGLLPEFDLAAVRQLSDDLVRAITAIAKPATISQIGSKLDNEQSETTLDNLARINKRLSHFDGKWGLVSWPEVNPRSIRDKTYLVLTRHGQPLHFSDIASHIRALTDTNGKRNVTVQAVHNELIKDSRFILIGRGIYALAEWGYTPGTVADIIADVLRGEKPLHKDEIVKRVLDKRQVKTTTIILNLQEKEQFVRIAKATYTLKDKA